MSGDAIVLFHPKDPDTLTPFLDLDDESDESDESERPYAEALEDGTFLVHTFQPFEVFVQNPDAASEWLAQFGDDLSAVHDDPRGFFFFPDDLEPEATSYEGLLAEIGDGGIFLGGELEGDEGAFDIGALQALAGQLLGAQAGDASPPGAFEVGRMIQNLQQNLIDALGIDPAQLDLASPDDGPGVGAGHKLDAGAGDETVRPSGDATGVTTGGPSGDATGEPTRAQPAAPKPAKKP